MERHWLTCAEVSCHRAERNPHVFEAMGFEQSLQEWLHALAHHESHPAETPAGHVAEPHGAACTSDFIGLGAARTGGGDNRPRAHPCDAVKRNVVALENAQDPGVRDAARETSAEGQSDSWRRHRCLRWSE